MKKFFLLLAMVFYVPGALAQKSKCDSPKKAEEESFISKCAVLAFRKKSEESNPQNAQINVNISANRRLYVKRQEEMRKLASSASNLDVAGVDKNLVTEDNTTLNIENTRMVTLEDISAEEVKLSSKFSEVDFIPSFEDCGGMDKRKQLNCFNQKMMSHIEKTFNYPAEAIKEKIEGQVWVRFIIDKDGNVRNIKAVGPRVKGADVLLNEAKRVVVRLPKFNAGTTDGRKVNVKYGFPINFSLTEK